MNASSFGRYFLLFCLLTVIAGTIYWLTTDEDDWWVKAVFVDRPPIYKFQFTLPEQAILSLLLGSMFAAPLTLLCFIIQYLRRR